MKANTGTGFYHRDDKLYLLNDLSTPYIFLQIEANGCLAPTKAFSSLNGFKYLGASWQEAIARLSVKDESKPLDDFKKTCENLAVASFEQAYEQFADYPDPKVWGWNGDRDALNLTNPTVESVIETNAFHNFRKTIWYVNPENRRLLLSFYTPNDEILAKTFIRFGTTLTQYEWERRQRLHVLAVGVEEILEAFERQYLEK